MRGPEYKNQLEPDENKFKEEISNLLVLVYEFLSTISDEPNFVKMRSGFNGNEFSVPILYQKLQILTQKQIKIRDATTNRFEALKKSFGAEILKKYKRDMRKMEGEIEFMQKIITGNFTDLNFYHKSMDSRGIKMDTMEQREDFK